MGKVGCAHLAVGSGETVLVGQMVRQAQTGLADTLGLTSSEARIEAQLLLGRALNDVSRAWLIAHEQDSLGVNQHEFFEALLNRRLSGEPIAYILGEREFYGLNFIVTPDTLIPRSDTELLVDLVLDRIPSLVSAFSLPQFLPRRERAVKPPLPAGEGWGGGDFRVLDMGTGSGAIALSFAHHRPHTEVWASDFSAPALVVAKKNSQQLGISNVHFVESNWFSAFNGQRFDIIVSNPPYIVMDDQHLSQGDVRFEPISALVSGKDGLDDIRHIISQASAYLNPGGWLLLEHGYDQAPSVRELLEESGFESVFSAKDISGIDRCTGGRFR